MFQLIAEIFKKESLLEQAYQTTIEMLKADAKMFNVTYNALSNRNSEEALKDMDIYATDQKINKYQREVRRKVLVYLATSTSKDIVFGLMLISIIIDVERIGDYAKNIMDLARAHPDPLKYYNFKEALEDIESKIEERFNTLIHAFEVSDDEMAYSLMSTHKEINVTCDETIQSIIQNTYPDIPTGDAASIALYSRYLKRTNAHITNIASSIVNTFENIGFSNTEKN